MGSKQRSPSSTELVLDGVFEDMGTYGAATGGWDLDFRQLDAGRLAARATLVAGERSAALRVGFNRRLHQQGSPPRGTVVLGIPDQPIVWCGVQAGAGEVLNFNMADGFEGVSEAGFRGTVLLVDPAEMELRAAESGLDIDLETLVKTNATWARARDRVGGLRGRLALLFRDACMPGGGATVAQLMNHDLASELVRTISVGSIRTEVEEVGSRRRALRIALERIEDPSSLPLSVADLCAAASVSPRTLYRAFQERFGISPKRYLQVRGLTGVREELLTARSESRVSDIANRWGFWHMGQFAADYRRQFGELPSDTLARR